MLEGTAAALPKINLYSTCRRMNITQKAAIQHGEAGVRRGLPRLLEQPGPLSPGRRPPQRRTATRRPRSAGRRRRVRSAPPPAAAPGILLHGPLERSVARGRKVRNRCSLSRPTFDHLPQNSQSYIAARNVRLRVVVAPELWSGSRFRAINSRIQT